MVKINKKYWVANVLIVSFVIGAGSLLTGCKTISGNEGNLQVYAASSGEAAWIRNGEPIEYEGEPWYPTDEVESFQNYEMIILGEYRGVTFFVDKVDVRPYDRLYTKFDKNKFRFFQKRLSK